MCDHPKDNLSRTIPGAMYPVKEGEKPGQHQTVLLSRLKEA